MAAGSVICGKNEGGAGGADIFTQVRNGTKTTITASDDLSILTGVVDYLFSGVNTLTSYENYDICMGLGSLQSCAGITTFKGCVGGTNAVYYTFQACASLTNVSIDYSTLIVAGVSALRFHFYAVPLLTSIEIIGMADIDSWNSLYTFQYIGSHLTSLTFTCEIISNLYVATLVNLNFASVLNLLTQLFDYSAGTARTITFNLTIADVGGQLSAAVATATARNWTVSGLTIT